VAALKPAWYKKRCSYACFLAGAFHGVPLRGRIEAETGRHPTTASRAVLSTEFPSVAALKHLLVVGIQIAIDAFHGVPLRGRIEAKLLKFLHQRR